MGLLGNLRALLRGLRTLGLGNGAGPLPDWNVIIGVKADGYQAAQLAMEGFGPVQRGGVGNVLTLTVDDPGAFVGQVANMFDTESGARDVISGVVPLQHTFDFDSEEDFAENVGSIISENWRTVLRGRKNHIRTHRRGLVSEVPRKPDPGERPNDVVDEFGVWGAPLEVDYETCDFVITVETLHRRAGLSLWSYDDFKRYSFLDIP